VVSHGDYQCCIAAVEWGSGIQFSMLLSYHLIQVLSSLPHPHVAPPRVRSIVHFILKRVSLSSPKNLDAYRFGLFGFVSALQYPWFFYAGPLAGKLVSSQQLPVMVSMKFDEVQLGSTNGQVEAASLYRQVGRFTHFALRFGLWSGPYEPAFWSSLFPW